MGSITSSVTRASVELASHRVLLARDAQLKRAPTFVGDVTGSFMLCRDGGRPTVFIEDLHDTLRHVMASPAAAWADGTVDLSHKNHPGPDVSLSVLPDASDAIAALEDCDLYLV